MSRLLRPAVLVLLLLTSRTLGDEPIAVDAGDWPWWRGPSRNGVADPKQTPPLEWSATQNIAWKVAVPGRGHGAPIVVGDQVILATAEEEHETQSLLCYDRRTGARLWQAEVHRGGFEKKGNAKSTLASATPACDGKRIYINFLHAGAIYTTALDRAGNKLWQTKVTDYILHQGFGSSPALFGGLVLVSADNKGTGVLAALDRASGKIVWQQSRPQAPNYASPIVLSVAGKDQLFMIGCDLVSAFEPLTGRKLWEIKGATTECVTSTVTDGQLIFTSGGYPRSHLAAVRADGSGQVAWENNTKIYVPSLLARNGYLYAVGDAGVAACWECATGKELWKSRLQGVFTAAPILVGDLIFATNEAGRTFIFKANPIMFELVAENQLGDEVFATAAICDSRIYQRVALREQGRRQEWLYCIARRD